MSVDVGTVPWTLSVDCDGGAGGVDITRVFKMGPVSFDVKCVLCWAR